MTVQNALLRAKTVGVRNFKDHISKFIRSHHVLIVTEHGRPASVVMPYYDMLEIVDILDEARDRAAVRAVTEGRRAIRSGKKGVRFGSVIK